MKKIIRVKGLCCANCANKIENGIKKLDGVKECVVSFMNQKIILDVEDDKKQAVIDEAVKICKRVEPDLEISL